MIQKYLNELNSDQQKFLLYALEEGISQYVKLPNGRFIGVNLRGSPNLNIKETKGKWSCGDIER